MWTFYELICRRTKLCNWNYRYKKFYPAENNAWGEFQAHRRVLGIVCLAQCNNPEELTTLYKLYEGIKSQYGNTIYDARLIVFGLDPDQAGSHAGTPDVARKNGTVIPESEASSHNINSLNDHSSNTGTNEQSTTLEQEVTSLVTTITEQSSSSAKPNGEAKTVTNDLNENSVSKAETGTKTSPSQANLLKPPTTDTVSKDAAKMRQDGGDLSVNSETPRGERSSSMISQSSDSSSGSSFSRDAPPYVMFFPDSDDCPKLDG